MPPPDPALSVLEQQTQEQNIRAQQTQSTLDTAHLMQRYGIMSALAGSSAPLSAGAQTVAASLGGGTSSGGFGALSGMLNSMFQGGGSPFASLAGSR